MYKYWIWAEINYYLLIIPMLLQNSKIYIWYLRQWNDTSICSMFKCSVSFCSKRNTNSNVLSSRLNIGKIMHWYNKWKVYLDYPIVCTKRILICYIPYLVSMPLHRDGMVSIHSSRDTNLTSLLVHPYYINNKKASLDFFI